MAKPPRNGRLPADLPDVQVPAKGPFNMDVATYGIPGDKMDGEAIVELGGMRYGNMRQINPATARQKQDVPHLDIREEHVGRPPAFSSMGTKKPRD